MVDPRFMCRQHLLGEHSELHKFLPGWKKRRSLTGYIKSNAVEPGSYIQRHEILVQEMISRGYNHASPLEQPDFSYLSSEEQNAKVDVLLNLYLLINRCPACKARIDSMI